MRKALFSIVLALFTLLPFFDVLAVDTNYRFTGQELDPSSNLYYYGQRYYDSNTGHFTQPDPVLKNLNNPQALKQQTGQDLESLLSNPQALNEYGYVQNNPVKYVDPEGESVEDIQKYVDRTGDTLSNLFSESQSLVSQHNLTAISEGEQGNSASDFATDVAHLGLKSGLDLAKNTANLFLGEGVGNISANFSGLDNLANALDRGLSGEERISEGVIGAVKLVSSLSMLGGSIGNAEGLMLKVSKNKSNKIVNVGIGAEGTKDQLFHAGINAVNTSKGVAIKGWHIGVGKTHIFLNPVKQIKYWLK